MPGRSIIAAGHPLTVEAAAHAISAGGNAFDAMLAGWLASCLAEAVLTSPAGGGFAMVWPESGSPRLYDFFTQTPINPNPKAVSYPLEANFGSTRQVFHLGPGTVATPGCVAGILQIHMDHGIIPVAECAEPARQMARNGFTVSAHAATLLEVVADLYRATDSSRQLFSSKSGSNRMLQEGELFENPEFENFLDMIIEEGARWFYEGDISMMVDKHCREEGGHLTREDFSRYKVEIRKPLELVRNGGTIWLNPPPSMGGTLVALGLVSRTGKNPLNYPFTTAADWADWIEPLRLMTLLRQVNAGRMCSGKDFELISAAIGKSESLSGAVRELFPDAGRHWHSTGTTQLSIIDSRGNEVSMTTSNGAGSAIILKETGIMLNNMLGEEDLQPAGLHTWEPDRRLASMMAPTLARLANGTLVALGSGGSNRIRSTVLQILRHLVDANRSVEEAVHAPRLHWEENKLHAETEAAHAILSCYPEVADTLVEHPVPNLFFGGAHCVARRADGSLHGIGDFRRGGVFRIV